MTSSPSKYILIPLKLQIVTYGSLNCTSVSQLKLALGSQDCILLTQLLQILAISIPSIDAEFSSSFSRLQPSSITHIYSFLFILIPSLPPPSIPPPSLPSCFTHTHSHTHYRIKCIYLHYVFSYFIPSFINLLTTVNNKCLIQTSFNFRYIESI